MRKISERMKAALRFAVPVAVICPAVLLAVFPVSCRMSEEGLKILDGDYTPPSLEAYAVTGKKTVALQFSKKITVENAVIIPVLHTDADDISQFGMTAQSNVSSITANISYASDDTEVTASTADDLVIGSNYHLYGTAKDEIGNTLTFCVPFVGFNDRVPKIILVAVKPGYSKLNSEFVELYTLTAGNLAGLTIESASDGEKKRYRFPVLEVSAGRFIVVHMRCLEESAVNETDVDLNCSAGKYATPTALDLWADNTEARFHDDCDVIRICNSADNSVLDAVVYVDPEMKTSKKADVVTAAQKLVDDGIWAGGDFPGSAASAQKLTPSKMLVRCNGTFLAAADEQTRNILPHSSAGEWKVCPVMSGRGKSAVPLLGMFAE